MVATLYDESLDAFAPLNWPHRFSVFREDYSPMQSQFANTPMGFQQVFGNWAVPYEGVEITYRSFPPDLTVNLWGYRLFIGIRDNRCKRCVAANRRERFDATRSPPRWLWRTRPRRLRRLRWLAV